MTSTVADSIRLWEAGAFAEAIALGETLAEDPAQRPAALQLLGLAAIREGEADRGLGLFEEALRLRPDDVECRYNLGLLALEHGAIETAVHHIGAVAARTPGDPAVHTSLGNALSKAGRHADAVEAHERAIGLAPRHPGLWNNLASAYLAWGKLEAAEAGHAYAARLGPDDPELLVSLGAVQTRLDKLEASRATLEAAVALAPRHARARTSLGVVKRALGELEGGLADAEAAFRLDPLDHDVRWNLGLAHLFHGRWASGWELYEARRERMPQRGREGYGLRWDGTPCPDQVVVVEREQGLGDSIMFARFLPDARDRVGRLVFRAQERLVPLLQSGLRAPGVEIAPFELEPFAGLYAPSMSLPHLLGLAGELRAERVPYLSAPAARVDEWGRRLGPRTGRPRVGLVWQGNPGFPNDRSRSIPLEALRPLLEIPEVEIIALQQVHGLDQLDELPPETRPRRLEGAVDADGAFLDTAAVMTHLDLVVTVDSAPAHLAGALGRPTALLLSMVPDWRWGRGTQCWYPTMQELRQQRRGDWSHPVRGAVEQVRALRVG